MDPRHRAGIETGPRRSVCVAGVRTRPRDHGAEDEHEHPHGIREPGKARRDGRDEQGARASVDVVAVLGAAQHRGGDGDQDDRGEEVEGDDHGVEAGPDGDAAHDRLDEDPDDHGPAEQVQLTTVRQQGRHRPESQHCDDDEHAGEGAVAELDELVETLRLRRDRGQRTLRTGRPVGAPEPAAGEPDDAAGDDDEDFGNDVRHEDGS